MRMKLHRKDVLAIGALALVAAWAPNAQAATAEERAKCEEMVKKMGTEAPHDHGKEKTGAPNAMTTEHVRCKEILAEPADGHKEGSKHEQK
jgi:hypothetical protein